MNSIFSSISDIIACERIYRDRNNVTDSGAKQTNVSIFMADACEKPDCRSGEYF